MPKMQKIKLLILVLLFSLFNQKAFAKWRFSCDGLNTQNLVINVTEESLVIDDGKFNFKMKIKYIGSEEVEAQDTKYKNFFSSDIKSNIVFKMNLNTGAGNIEFFSDWKNGVANKYQVLKYINCKNF
jgi:hypothetical protein